MTKKKYSTIICLLAFFWLAGQAKAQQVATHIDIKGTIVNEHKEPLVATILVKGTSIGTSSNEAGAFEIKQVNKTATLVISGIGIAATEIPVNGRSNLGRITIASSITNAEEVVVKASTGYQTIKPNEINGSVVVIDSRQLNLQTGTNILNRLDGAVSGLLFNIGKTNENSQNKTGITIRGLGTINGPLDPLIVLDGFIYEGNIENLNPNDVDNITILKDAAAASVWGARAGNGVIVISTKKGMLHQKLQVTASTGLIYTERPDLSTIPQINTPDFIGVEQMLFNQGYFNGTIAFSPHVALTPAVKVFSQRRAGLISASDSAARIDALKQTDARSQYEKYVYRSGQVQQHYIGLRGGGENNAYHFAAGYDNTIGTLRETYKKLNLRFGNIYQLHPRVKLSIESYYTNSKGVSGQTPYGTLRPANNRFFMYEGIVNADGSPAGIDLNYNTAYTDTLLNGRLLDQRYYPLEDYKHNRTTTNLQEINANLGLNVAIFKFLQLDVKYQYQLQHAAGEKLADQDSYEARELINSYTQPDLVTGTLKYMVPAGGIRTLSNDRVGSQTFRAQLNFNKVFGQHRLDAIAGTESREQRSTGDGYTVYGYNADPLTTAVVDMVNDYTDPISGYAVSLSRRPTAGKKTYRFTSVYLNASWLWKEKYSVSASGRRDGSNIFGASTNDRWKPLWSVGGSWRISREPFFSSKVINDLRLKLTYGHSGNVDLSKTAVPIASLPGNDVNTGLPFSRIRQINNPTLRWEQVQQINIGAEFSAFNNRISGSLDWYAKEGTDLYGPIEWDYTSFGISSTIVQNVADTKGRGVDLMLNSKNMVGSFEWETGLLLGYNKTVTKRYFGPQANGQHTLLGGGNKITPVVGRDVYGIMAYRWGGLDAEGNPQGYLNGMLSKDYYAISQESGTGTNLVYFGSGTPRFFGALRNSFGFGKMMVTINITGKFGYHFFKPALVYAALLSGSPATNDYTRRWQQPGDELLTDVPALIYPGNVERDYFYAYSSVNVLNGSHLRLQYINFTYSPALKVMNGITTLQFYINAANLGVLWRANDQDIDPDYPRGLSPAKTWSFGVRANF